MPRLRLPPRALGAGKEVDSGRGRLALQPDRAPSAGARQSSPLVALPQPRVAPSAAGAPIVPRRLQAPRSCTTAWPQQQGSETPVGKVAERQHHHWHRRSRPRWCVSCCRTRVRVPAALVRGRAAGRQPNGVHAGCRSPRGAPPTQERPALGVDRGARHPCLALGVEGPVPRRAGVSPPRVRQAEPTARRRCCGGAEPAPVRSCSTKRQCKHCTPTWGRGVARSVPSGSS
jgi:hypothetical protein